MFCNHHFLVHVYLFYTLPLFNLKKADFIFCISNLCYWPLFCVHMLIYIISCQLVWNFLPDFSLSLTLCYILTLCQLRLTACAHAKCEAVSMCSFDVL